MWFDGLEYLTDFASGSEITANWLLNQIVPEGKGELRITTTDDELIAEFLKRLADGRLFMHDGQHGLLWLDDRLKKRLAQAEGQRTEAWEKIRERYRYILAKIAFLVSQMDRKEFERPPEDDTVDRPGGLTAET